MGWRIRAVVVTELAVITFLLDPFVIRGGQTGDVALILVDAVQQRVEGRTEVETATTAVADVEYAIRLLYEIVSRPVRGNEVNIFQRRSSRRKPREAESCNTATPLHGCEAEITRCSKIPALW